MRASFGTGQLTALRQFAMSAKSYADAVNITLKYLGIRQSVGLLETSDLGDGAILTTWISDYSDL